MLWTHVQYSCLLETDWETCFCYKHTSVCQYIARLQNMSVFVLYFGVLIRYSFGGVYLHINTYINIQSHRLRLIRR
jgi:hypothetical protein